jgi:hypothetical protein
MPLSLAGWQIGSTQIFLLGPTTDQSGKSLTIASRVDESGRAAKRVTLVGLLG